MSQIQENLVAPRQAAEATALVRGPKSAASSVSEFTMKDGTKVSLRPIRPDDELLVAEFHKALSDRTVYMRYFCSVSLRSRVEHKRLARICNVDGRHEMALVAEHEDKSTGSHQVLGIGRLIKLNTQSEAEVAILVADPYQKQGLGTELLRCVIGIAHQHRLRRVRGELLRDNFAMKAILRKCGFRVGLRFDSPSITAVLEIGSRL
jgi:acetyltransferase